MSPTRTGLLAVTLCAALVAAPSCSRRHSNEAAPGQKLDPLPPPPALAVPKEPVPGNGQLAVVAARPLGQANPDAHPTITFSKPVVTLAMIEDQPSGAAVAHISPALPGQWRWLGSASVELVPDAIAPYSTRFEVTVDAGLKALDGSRLEQPYHFTFETPPPVLQHTDPWDGTRWVRPDSKITLLFNQPVADLLSQTSLHITGSSAPVPLTLLKTASIADEEEQRQREQQTRTDLRVRELLDAPGFKSRQTRYELAPAATLPLNAELTLEVGAALHGAEGPRTLGQAKRITFHTPGPMKVTKLQACLFGAYEESAGRRPPCTYGPLVLLTSNRVDPATATAALKQRLHVEPPVEIDWDRVETGMPSEWDSTGSPHVAIPGKFKPGTRYKVSLAEGVADELGQKAAAFEGTVRLDDFTPSLDIGAHLALLESHRDGALPVESVNVRSARAQIWTLTPEDLARQLNWRESYGREQQPIPPTAPAVVSLDLSGSPNIPKRTPLSLRSALGPRARSGFFLVKVGSEEIETRNSEARQVLAQLTDLAVHAKLGPASGVLWVTRLSTGAPVSGANLRLLDSAGATRWQGASDASGIAHVPGLAELRLARPHPWSVPFALAVAQKDDQMGATLSTWDQGLQPTSFSLQSAWDDQHPISLGTIFAERGIYRPGDTVHLKGLLRVRRLGAIEQLPRATALELTVTSSRGDKLRGAAVKLTEFGTFESELTLPADAALGFYQVAVKPTASGEDGDLSWGGNFRVEEYRAPQFQVDVALAGSAGSADVVASDALEAKVLGRYLFGGAMSGARVHWSASRNSTEFEPPGNTGYDFGTHTWGWDDGEPASSSDLFGGGDGVLDAQGALAVSYGRAEAPAGKTFRYTLEAEVTDVNRQRVANRASLLVHPAAIYGGVRLAQSGFAEAGKPAQVEMVAASPSGARQAGVALSLKVSRREWKSIRKKGVGDQWFTESEPVEIPVTSCKATSEATPVRCEIKPEQPGLHLLELTATDAKGRTQVTRSAFYAIGNGWVSWQRNDTDRIDLVADKTLYGVGDTARILVKSPYPEADALLTVEREGVMRARRVHLSGAATTLEVALDDEALVPNAFVGVIIVRGRVPGEQGIETGQDPGRPAVRVGYVALHVEKKSKRLAVEIMPSTTEARPRDTVHVDLQVTDWKGKAAPSEVTVWAVDEAVLRLTDYHVPDPVDAIHPPRGLSVRIGEPLLHLVLAQLYGEKGETAGGGGGMEALGGGLRSRFKTTALFRTVTTDATGRARVNLELPDNLTTFRLLAVAATRDDRFGSSEARVKVSKPLLAMPALPRLARVGDRFEAGVVVHRHGGAALPEVKVTAKATGLTLDGPAEKTVSLAEGEPREVRFAFRAEQAGTATLRFAVEANGAGGAERDGVEQSLPVVLPVSMEAVATYGDTPGSRTEGLVPPGGVRAGIGGLEVSLASTALGNFDESMRQLIDYPYGCLEQLSSRLVPLIALRELHGTFGVPWRGADSGKAEGADLLALIFGQLNPDTLAIRETSDPDEMVRRTISTIERLQNADGGFRYWPSDACSADYASAYAVLALARAHEVGYAVSEPALQRGQRYLADHVAAGRCTNCGWGCYPPDDATRVFALYALARSGAPRPSYYGELFGRRESLPLFARAMLADALFVGGGDRAQARQLLAELMSQAKETPAEVHFEESNPLTYAPLWSSDARTTAIVLQTLADISPEHPYVAKIAHYLTRARQSDGRFRNTQEASFALMALTEVVRVKEREAPDFTARVTLGGAELTAHAFKGRSMRVEHATVPIDKLPRSDEKASLPFVFSKGNSPGVLYYGALLRYAPAQLPTTALERGMAVQRWFEPYAGGGQSRRFFAGDLVRIRIRVATSQERNFVAVDVPLPAGLEVLNTSLASTARLPSLADRGGRDEETEEAQPESFFAESFFNPFNHIEKRDDRVVLFADRLPPGVHVASFVARASTPGDFVLKPAQAEEMYTPEVFGRSDGGRFAVELAAPTAER